MKDLLSAPLKYFAALKFVRKHKLWWFLFIPGLVNIGIIVGIIVFSITYSSEISNFILGQPDWLEKLPKLLSGIIIFSIGFVIRLVLFTIYFYLYKTVVMIVLSPMLSYLAEKVRFILTGEEKPFTWEQLVSDSIRGVRISLRSLFMEMLAFGLIFLLGLIPVVGFLAPILAIAVQSYFHGFSMLDFCMEARGYNYKDSVNEIKNRKQLAIGNGIVFYGLTLIPVIGWMFAPTLGIIAAYLSLENRNE